MTTTEPEYREMPVTGQIVIWPYMEISRERTRTSSAPTISCRVGFGCWTCEKQNQEDASLHFVMSIYAMFVRFPGLNVEHIRVDRSFSVICSEVGDAFELCELSPVQCFYLV